MKRLLFIITLIFFSFNTYAQNFEFGVRGGLNLAKLQYSNDEFEGKFITTFHLGLLGEYSFSEVLSLQPEILFYTGGTREEYSFGKFKTRSSNVAIPVLVKFKVADKINLEAGPVYNLLLSIETSDENEENFEDIKDFYKSSSFAVALGAEYDLVDLLEGLRAGVRYQHGLSQLNKDSSDLNGETVKGHSLFFTFSYRFDLGKKEE